MDEERINTAGRLRGLLAVAASSVITAILANVDRDLGSPLLWVARPVSGCSLEKPGEC